MKRSHLLFSVSVLTGFLSLSARAQEECHRRPPPEEAFEACEGLKANDACSFEDPDGNQISGQCFSPEASRPLACRPKDRGEGHKRGPGEKGGRGQEQRSVPGSQNTSP